MKKNIAIIVQKLNGGGAERTASNLSVFLSDDYNVHLIVFDGREIKYPIQGELHDLKLYPKDGKLNKLITMLRRVAAIRKIKKECGIETSISLMDGANIVNCLSSTGDKIITSVRIQMSKSRFKSLKARIINRSVMKWIEKKSNYIVALSEGVNDDLVEKFGVAREKVVTIYNPCDGELLREKAKANISKAATMPERSITTMGRFTEQKGQWHLIRAFSEVVKKVPDAKLYILGQGPLEKKLREIVDRKGLSEHVIFLGFVEAPHAYIMKSKAFVFPTNYEGLGNVLLESIACGVPAISTDCYSGPREILDPGKKVKEQLDDVEYAQYGILVSVCGNGQCNAEEPLTKQELQMAEAIIHILTDQHLHDEYVQKALIRAKSFEPEVIKSEWMKLI